MKLICLLLVGEFPWAVRGGLVLVIAGVAASFLGMRFSMRPMQPKPKRSRPVVPTLKGLNDEVHHIESVLLKHANREEVSVEERDHALMALERLQHRLEGTRREEAQRYIESGLELSKSEREVLKLMREGHSPQRIAKILGCSLSRVYKARSGLRSKLQVPEDMGLLDFMRSLPD